MPASVTIVEVTEAENEAIMKKTHEFDPIAKKVVKLSTEKQNQMSAIIASADSQKFLDDTDWKVLRHIRQQALGQVTSLSQAEYVALEAKRQEAATSIIKPPTN